MTEIFQRIDRVHHIAAVPVSEKLVEQRVNISHLRAVGRLKDGQPGVVAKTLERVNRVDLLVAVQITPNTRKLRGVGVVVGV